MLIEMAISIKATLTEVLSRMEACGLVHQEHDPANKHHRFVYPVEQGEALLNRSIPQGNEIDDEFLGRLDDGEREQFIRLVRKVMASWAGA